MHLLSFLVHSPINHTAMTWANADDQRIEGLQSFKYWQDIARTLERGKFDGVFFADIPAALDEYRDRIDESVKHGVLWPSQDPMALLSVMASATQHLGFAATLSVAAIPPYIALRTLSTLDYLSRGRIGWNIVTGHLRAEHRALGLEQLEHDERYDRAEEYMAICYGLWNSVDHDALVFDRASGVLIDPSKVRRFEFKGKYFNSTAVSPTLPSPQGRPVLFQAGSSGRGQAFAVKHADVIFGIQPHVPGMKKMMEQVRAAATTGGRTDPVRVSFGIQPVVAGTELEAKRLQKELTERIPDDAGLARVSGTLGVDFSKLDLDQPMSEMDTQASRGLMAALSAVVNDKRMTLREAATRWGASTGMPQIVGTPEQVATEMEAIWRDTGCIGFNVTPTITPSSIDVFVDQVIPVLQKRGVFRTDYEGTTFSENLLS